MAALRIDTALPANGEYAIEARNLRVFYGDFLAVKDVDDTDLVILIRNLYITLADVDNADSARPILEAMSEALDYRNETEEAKKLGAEIISWLDGRAYVQQNQYDDALNAYNEAVTQNSDNPATLYERARVLIALLEYQQALGDLEVYLNQPVGVGEHSNISTEIEKILKRIKEHDDIIAVINEHFKIDDLKEEVLNG